MASVWHDGLVEAFPVPVKKLHSTPFNSQPIEDAIKALTLSPPITSSFPFFSLPAEIRNRIYSLVLFSPTKFRKPSSNRPPPTSLYLISSRTHREASYIFYTTQTFRLFPLQEFKPLPTVCELAPRYRSLVTNTELILGPGWTAPPKSWKVTQRMAKILRQLCRVRCLRVFVEVDPSHPLFARFRVSHGFYTQFAGKLLGDVLAAMPQVEFVQLDGNPSVQMDGPLVVRLRTEIEGQGRVVKWGKERGWLAADREGLQAEIGSQDGNDWTAETQSSNEMLREVGTASA